MNGRAPRISVCIPTRDRARWLGGALQSVFKQTVEDFEVVVFDDASTDATAEVVARWRDARLRYRRHAEPVGVAANRNACLSLARGRYVAWLDSDDLYHPRMLEAQSGKLDAMPRVALVHGAVDIIDGHGKRLPDWPPPFAGDVVEKGASAFRELVLQNYVAAPTVMVRRRVQEAAGPYRPWLQSGEDWDMWLRIALRGDLAYTAERLACYRWHAASLTRRTEASGAHLRRDLRILSRLFAGCRSRLPDADALEARARAGVATRAVRDANDRLLRGDRIGALRGVLLALRARPRLARDAAARKLLAAALRSDEYGWHVASRELLRLLADAVDGSRLADDLHRRVAPQHEWEGTLHRIARTVREVVPPDDAIAVVDKWDPTLLHLTRRRGWHFPDRRTMPGGYPPDSSAAVHHLEDLRRRGVRYLVVPCSAFWWLDCYEGLARHLDAAGVQTHADERCVIYRLVPGATCAA